MGRFEYFLTGRDLRSIGMANQVVTQIKNQEDFDELFTELYNSDRKVVMRAADAIEKVSITNSDYLYNHTPEIMALFDKAKNIELKWHLAQLIPRLKLNETQTVKIWKLLLHWANDNRESNLVRVNALQSLCHLKEFHDQLRLEFEAILIEIEKENIPSLNARIRKLRKGSQRLPK